MVATVAGCGGGADGCVPVDGEVEAGFAVEEFESFGASGEGEVSCGGLGVDVLVHGRCEQEDGVPKDLVDEFSGEFDLVGHGCCWEGVSVGFNGS